jgi:hypothetical protein
MHDFLVTVYCMLLKCILDAYSKQISQKDITCCFGLLSRVSPKGNKWDVNGLHKNWVFWRYNVVVFWIRMKLVWIMYSRTTNLWHEWPHIINYCGKLVSGVSATRKCKMCVLFCNKITFGQPLINGKDGCQSHNARKQGPTQHPFQWEVCLNYEWSTVLIFYIKNENIFL